jgi:hypothetical protein
MGDERGHLFFLYVSRDNDVFIRNSRRQETYYYCRGGGI